MPPQRILSKETRRELARLADTLGMPQEAALLYALRLVNACIEEGLLPDVKRVLGPQAEESALRSTGTQGKVLHFKQRT